MTTLRACLFELSGERFAVEVSAARGVVVFDDATRVPGAPPHVLGVANLRGRVVPLLDVRRHLGLPAAGRGRGAKALVIEHGHSQVAVAIDEILGLEGFDEARAPHATERARYGEFGLAVLSRPEGAVTLLDAPRMIEDLRVQSARPSALTEG